MLKIALIMLGGAAGSLLRYLVQGWTQDATRSTFPVGTLLVNVLGCFLIGVLNMLFSGPVPIRMEYRLGLTVGLLGGFTTFSAFGWETFSLANERDFLRALANVVLSLAAGLLAVWLGYKLAQRVYGV